MSHLHPGPTANRSGDATMTGPLSVILDRNVAAGMGLLLHPLRPSRTTGRSSMREQQLSTS